MKSKVYVIFGAGKGGKELADVFPERVSYLVDNDPYKWGTYYNGILINNPEQLLRENKDDLRIFIASMYFDQIKIQLDMMGFKNKKHYFNIIPYYILLNRMTFLDAINFKAEDTVDQVQRPISIIDRFQQIFDIQEEFLQKQVKNRILLVVNSNEYCTELVTNVQYSLKELFKLKVLMVSIDLSAPKDDLERIARKYRMLGYSRLLYAGQYNSDVENFERYFNCFHSIDVALQSPDEKRWVDYMYHVVNSLGFAYKKVSVVVPNYNYDHYLCTRLRSIIGQQYPIYEILFLDDASSDDSVMVAEGLLDEYCGLKRSIINNTNSGSVFKQWKKGIEAVQGDYIWITEADDYASPIMLSNLMASFTANEDVVMSFCDSMFVDSRGEWEGFSSDARVQYIQDKGFNGGIYDGKEFIKEFLTAFNSIPNVSAVVMKRNGVSRVDLDKLETFKQCGDWYLYLQLLTEAKVAYHTKPMNFFRRQSGSVTINMKKEELEQELCIIRQAVEKILFG